eukprot:CAMPEP_0181340906 /NCGR_PEP_ID=MMETSP1101-20121128/30105_1 /TAXON_ID=46948 /ORGANISM="Rhodomonas abbreviata, Strain Caron Lab Isolate" /LENGTH=182 /DNA_ID=CAMNT_0023452105 /DNA_START=8 /DNA_END=556 /DNA_ORIENTATION=+
MASKTFEWPSHYHFPPFFTKQPNSDTNTQRIQHWKSLILSYCQHHRIFVINVREMMQSSPLFFNEKISRRLQFEDAVEILQYMSAAGLSEWLSTDKNRCLVYWRKPTEWADALYAYADANALTDSVLTLYEIREGEDTTLEFHGMDHGLLVKVVEILEKQGRAVMFDAGSPDTAGVKFLPPQ